MAKKAATPPRLQTKRKIEHYTHVGKDRANNPPVGLVTPETDRDADNKNYTYDPHIDPALQWAGKAERTSFEIPTVSLHVHERIDSRSIIKAVRKKNGEDFVHGSLFSRLDENRRNRVLTPSVAQEAACARRLDSLLARPRRQDRHGRLQQIERGRDVSQEGRGAGGNRL